jgi:hypothetical protein
METKDAAVRDELYEEAQLLRRRQQDYKSELVGLPGVFFRGGGCRFGGWVNAILWGLGGQQSCSRSAAHTLKQSHTHFCN